MDREYLMLIVSENIELIRREKQFSQHKMAELLGISKNKLKQIEKNRSFANWTTTIAICLLFRDHFILREKVGGDPIEKIELIINDSRIQTLEKTLGGLIFWKNICEYKGFKLQRNILSTHYRILDDENYRIISSFNEIVVKEKWQEIKKMV